MHELQKFLIALSSFSDLHDFFIFLLACPFPKLNNADISPEKSSYEPGDNVTITCDNEYAFEDTFLTFVELVCDKNGTFLPMVGNCKTGNCTVYRLTL